MVVPCSSVQLIEEVLEDCTRNVIPVILYAINQDSLRPEQVAELWKVKEMLSFPICFVRIPGTTTAASPEPSRRGEKEKDREKSALHKQLLSLGFLNSQTGNCSCGAPTQMPNPGAKPQSVLGESFDRLHRLLVPFTRQVLQNQQVEAANLLNGLHCRCLDLFINQVRGWHVLALLICIDGFTASIKSSEIYRHHCANCLVSLCFDPVCL